MHIELAIQSNDSQPTTTPAAKKPWSPTTKMFPVLVILLMACYGIMTMVLVEQGSVIQSQRNLIGQLMQDGQQLSAYKGQELAQKAIEKKQAAAAKSRQNADAKICKSCKARVPSSHSQQNMEDKQPLQTADRADFRRFPSKI